jgi:hypothetical protein
MSNRTHGEERVSQGNAAGHWISRDDDIVEAAEADEVDDTLANVGGRQRGARACLDQVENAGVGDDATIERDGLGDDGLSDGDRLSGRRGRGEHHRNGQQPVETATGCAQAEQGFT